MGSHLNRASLPRGGKAAHKRKSVSGVIKRRESYHPGAATGRRRSSVASRRRSSVYGGGTTSTKMVDSRPLKDKSYQKRCIRMIIEFLMERGYDHPISPHILTRPTARDFHAIVEFLLKRIDPNFKFKGRIEDELPRKFKALKYPFAISKTALQAVGAPHTWPPLLGALVWLIELLKYDESSSKKEEEEFEIDGVEKLFYSYLSDAYGHYMAGDDERATQLDDELTASFEERNTQLQKMKDDKIAEMEALRAKMKEMTAEENSIPGLTRKRATYEADKAKFEELVGKLERRQTELHRRLDSTHDECAAGEEKLEGLRTLIKKLELRVENQELSAADVEHMGKEKRMLKESAEKVAAQKDAAQSALWELEMALSREMEGLNTKIQEYHDQASGLHLLPSTAKYAQGVDYEVRLAASGGRGGAELLATDTTELARQLKKLKQRFTNQRFDALTACDDLNDVVSDKRAAKREAEQGIGALEARLAKLDEDHKTEKVEMERSRAAMHDEMADVEAEIEGTQRVIEEEAAAAAGLEQAALDRAEAEFLEHATQLQDRRLAVRTKIATALEYLTDHKTRIQAQLEGVAAELDARKAVAKEAAGKL